MSTKLYQTQVDRLGVMFSILRLYIAVGVKCFASILSLPTK